MITPMKKLTLLCLEQDRKVALAQLRDLGVVHLKPAELRDRTGVDEARIQVEQIEHLQQGMARALEEVKASSTVVLPDTTDEAIAEGYQRLERLQQLQEEDAALRHLLLQAEPFGDFDPMTLARLKEQGVHVLLCRARQIADIRVPEGATLEVLSEDKKSACVVLISSQPLDGVEGATRYTPPAQSLREMQTKLETIVSEKERQFDYLAALSAMKDEIAAFLLVSHESLDFEMAHAGMGEHGRICTLQGYCPAQSVAEIEHSARRHGWGIVAEEPDLDDTQVPTLLKMPKWVQPIKAVFQILSILPGYRESDISAFFLIFFSIFFAILIGDAGYGLLFLVATVAMRMKMPKAPSYPFVLFGILSVATLIWGGMTGNWFGIQPEFLPAPLKAVQIPILIGEQSRDPVITLCFLIGAVHLTIAHVWNTIALAPSLKALAQIGWIGLVWSMFLTAMNMVLGVAYPAWFLPLFVCSLALIILFMTPLKEIKREWIQHAMFPLSVVNCFVDIVSYIRLFAVGMASLSVAQSFNDMAMQIGMDKVWTAPIGALILLLGHGLNILLCALGILVHGVRLNTLEFSLHKNIEWKGIAYKPFARLIKTKTEQDPAVLNN